MFDVVLHNPAIPPNTGNVIRLCANSGARLHLVEPLGFGLDDARLRRAGLDYHEFASVRCHSDWLSCHRALGGGRVFAFTTRGSTGYHRVAYRPGDILLFGCETAGLPDEVRESVPEEQRLRLPMVADSRSLNLSNSVAIALYEAWRQNDYAGAT